MALVGHTERASIVLDRDDLIGEFLYNRINQTFIDFSDSLNFESRLTFDIVSDVRVPERVLVRISEFESVVNTTKVNVTFTLSSRTQDFDKPVMIANEITAKWCKFSASQPSVLKFCK